MNGILAQLIAMTCHGNAALKEQDIGDFFPKNSTFKYCQQVTFSTLDETSGREPMIRNYASEPMEWIEGLKAAGVLGIRICRQSDNNQNAPDRMLAGFVGGGGQWFMEVVYPDDIVEYWMAKWKHEQSRYHQKPWCVTYLRVYRGHQRIPTDLDFQTTRSRFIEALKEIHDYSKRIKYAEQFTDMFSAAIETIEEKRSEKYLYHNDMAPQGLLSGEAQLLLNACQQSWVFGGMGSWNDLGLAGEKEYDTVSEQLFSTQNEGFIAAVNESYCSIQNCRNLRGRG